MLDVTTIARPAPGLAGYPDGRLLRLPGEDDGWSAVTLVIVMGTRLVARLATLSSTALASTA